MSELVEELYFRILVCQDHVEVHRKGDIFMVVVTSTLGPDYNIVDYLE